MNIQLRRALVFNRPILAVLLIGLGFLLGFTVTWWVAWIPMLVGVLVLTAHFLIGPMTLVQSYVESGDIEGARALLARVKKPEWLYKPVRSSYYMLRGNLSTMTDDLDTAEADIRASLKAGLPEKEYEGSALMQLGMIAVKKGDNKSAFGHLRAALQKGLPDDDSRATACLQLSSICLTRRDFRGAKFYYGRAKAAKPKNEQVVEQLKEMGKYMARIPG